MRLIQRWGARQFGASGHHRHANLGQDPRRPGRPQCTAGQRGYPMNDASLRHNAIDPITLEVLRNALESIADEMGAVLKRTSFSPNIKERMDASCALFDAEAQLVAQA